MVIGTKLTAREIARICAADVVLRALRGRWATHILAIVAGHETIHFNSLKRAIPGISAKVPTDQLRYLYVAGVIRRDPTEKLRKEVAYSFTLQGEDLKQVLDSPNELAARWSDSPDQAATRDRTAIASSVGVTTAPKFDADPPSGESGDREALGR